VRQRAIGGSISSARRRPASRTCSPISRSTTLRRDVTSTEMIFTIAGKELKALFASPLAWVVLTVMQIIFGYNFLRRIDDFLQIQPRLIHMTNPPGVTELVVAPTFATAAVVLLFAVPLLAMRLIAEERRNQTMVFLMSAPVSITDIVLGKFLGLMGFLLVVIGLVALMPLALARGTAFFSQHLLSAVAPPRFIATWSCGLGVRGFTQVQALHRASLMQAAWHSCSLPATKL